MQTTRAIMKARRLFCWKIRVQVPLRVKLMHTHQPALLKIAWLLRFGAHSSDKAWYTVKTARRE